MTSRNIQSNQEKLNLNGDGIDYPLQYSCLGNPMEEESGRLQSTRSKKSDTTKQQHHKGESVQFV